jgi:hypothetical protein
MQQQAQLTLVVAVAVVVPTRRLLGWQAQAALALSSSPYQA